MSWSTSTAVGRCCQTRCCVAAPVSFRHAKPPALPHACRPPTCTISSGALKMKQGIAEVEQQYAGQDTVHFTDRLLFLVARKPAESAAAAGAGGSNGSQAALQQQQQGAQPPAGGQQRQQHAVLTPAQRQQYSEEGFTGPITMLTPDEAAALRQQLERYEVRLGGKITGDWRFKVSTGCCSLRHPAGQPTMLRWLVALILAGCPAVAYAAALRPRSTRRTLPDLALPQSHLLLPAVWDVAHHPAILAAVSEALGGCRNLLCWSTDIFKKEPGDGGFTGWHQVRQACSGFMPALPHTLQARHHCQYMSAACT